MYKPLQEGASGDITYGMDQLSEDIFIKYLQKYGQIHSEEAGVVGEGEYNIIIDPLDGSDNFLSNFPYYGTSVAYIKDKKCVAAVVTNLANGTIYIKSDLRHVYSPLMKLSYKDVVKNKTSKIGIFERSYKSKYYVEKLKEKNIKYRSPGAIALSLSLGHDISFLILEGTMRHFDVAAGLYMCDDLYQHKTNDLTIICQEEKLFEKLKNILL